ncbi:MAG: DUF6069 family protein [Chloroflexota bacterium]|nr:DUF6069 family protein [Chloroflexota bacterium]
MSSRSPAIHDGPAATDRPWWQLGLAAGVIAAVANVILLAAYQAVAGSPAQIALSPGAPLQALSWWQTVIASILPALIAALVAAACSRWTPSPRAWFIGLVVILAALTLVAPLSLPVATGNRLVLAIMHIVTAAAVIGALAPRLPAPRA